MKEKFVLLVEDNPDDEELTRMALVQGDIPNQIVVVRDGAEALKILFKQPVQGEEAADLPDLILLDLKLPKMNGLEVLDEIRANPKTRYIPVVVLTSSSEMNDILDSYRRGANSYIRKPVNFHEFKEMMNLLGVYWLVLNQNPPHSI